MKKEKYIAPRIEMVKTITESLLVITSQKSTTGTSDDPDSENVKTWFEHETETDDGTSNIDPD